MSYLVKTVAVVVVFVSVLVVGPDGAHGGVNAVVEHCVVEVIDQLDSGELVLSEPVCFESFAAAARAASSGAVDLDSGFSPHDLESSGAAMVLATFTLGVHYDGYGGGGSSISVVGSNCNGGYWNTPSWWDNRISSTWNGCYRIKHHDNPAMGGSYASTWGVGSVHNVPWSLNNKAESISYWNG